MNKTTHVVDTAYHFLNEQLVFYAEVFALITQAFDSALSYKGAQVIRFEQRLSTAFSEWVRTVMECADVLYRRSVVLLRFGAKLYLVF